MNNEFETYRQLVIGDKLRRREEIFNILESSSNKNFNKFNNLSNLIIEVTKLSNEIHEFDINSLDEYNMYKKII